MLCGAGTLALPTFASNGYPSRPIRLIVPYPPGGGIDAVARVYAEQLSRVLDQSIVVDNRPGAATNIGIAAAAKSDPDGYTLCIASTGLVNNQHFGPKPSYDTFRDLAPIGLLSSMPFMIAASPASGIPDMRTLLERARAAPNTISIGSSLRTQVEITTHLARIELLKVYYKGGAQAVVDAVAGQIDLVFGLYSVLMENARAGKLKLIAVADAQRSSLAPDVPTFAEAGIPGYPQPSWAAVMAPAGTPQPVRDRLEAATRQVTENPEFVSFLSAQGIEVTYRSAPQLAQMLREQSDESAALFKELGSVVG